MTIYADTSFLVSYLYPGDAQHSMTRSSIAQKSAPDLARP
jgi:hypothetical protein